MPNFARAITADGSAVALAFDSTQLVSRIEQIHQTSAVTTAALGRLATAAGMMGAMLKGEKDSLTLRIQGDGPAGTLIAVANSQGQVKAYVQNPIVEIPLNGMGKLDVAGAVGRNGFLSVVKDLGLKEPYCSQIPIVSGEVAEDITYYYAKSEQTPTVCGLGVLVNPDLTVRSAGGFLVQLLPFADEGCIDRIEENLKQLPPVSELFDSGLAPAQVCMKLLEGMEPNPLDEAEISYHCDCCRDRVCRALMSLGKQDLLELIEDERPTQVECHFCDKKYLFSKEELKNFLK